jgi:hypothetical protein
MRAVNLPNIKEAMKREMTKSWNYFISFENTLLASSGTNIGRRKSRTFTAFPRFLADVRFFDF